MAQTQIQTKQKEALKMSNQIVLSFPGELPAESWQDQSIFQKGKEAIILELLRKGLVSQGKAAELLGINRYNLFDLMALYKIPAFEATSAELDQEFHTLKGAISK